MERNDLIEAVKRVRGAGSYGSLSRPIVLTSSPQVAIELIMSLCDFRYMFQSHRQKWIWRHYGRREGPTFEEYVQQECPDKLWLLNSYDFLSPHVQKNIEVLNGEFPPQPELSSAGNDFGNAQFRDVSYTQRMEQSAQKWYGQDTMNKAHTMAANFDRMMQSYFAPTQPDGTNPIGRRAASLDFALNYRYAADRSASHDVIRLGQRKQLEFGLEHLFCIWVLKQMTVVSAPPVKMHMDDRFRFHHETEPAIEWQDGFKMCALSGLLVDDSKLLNFEQLSAEEILDEENVELRRVLLERSEPDMLMKHPRAQMVKADPRGKLWKIYSRIGRSRPWRHEIPTFVEVVNSSMEPDGTYKTYFLRVPPDIESPTAGIAWTFGLTEQEYKPLVES